ncbi:MAG: isoprenyl transferase [Gammaproteobacteria bacterium]|nr:isoprenyl transferase [Gammaproteobacteria bacterium]
MIDSTTKNLPRHIAIVMDGNGRWAKKRGLPRAAGHKIGADSVEAVVNTCARLGIQALSLFAFSTENWNRPKDEVSFLMDLLVRFLRDKIKTLHKNNIRFQMIGDRCGLNDLILAEVCAAEELTKNNSGLAMNIAINYSGRWDIANAAKNIAVQAAANLLKPEEICADKFREFTCLANLPDPDLLIRTSGEYRISNFMLWQLAYTELYFTTVTWPDFREKELEQAILEYTKRERRFGMISEQLAAQAK